MSSESTPSSQEVYLLPLKDNGAPDVPGQYIYLPPPSNPSYVVRFAIEGTSSICRQGSLWVNVPTAGEPFLRDQFQEFKWVSARWIVVLHSKLLIYVQIETRFQSDNRDRHSDLDSRCFRLLHDVHALARAVR